MTPIPGQLPTLFNTEHAAHTYAQQNQGFKHEQYRVIKGTNGYHVVRNAGCYQRPRRSK